MIGVKHIRKLPRSKILSFTLVVCILSAIFVSSFTANAESAEKKVMYITSTRNTSYKSANIEKISPESDSIDFFTNSVLWIDGDHTEKYKNELLERYKKYLKTIIISDSLSKNDVRQYYGVKELPLNKDTSKNKEFEDGTQIATVACKSKGLDIIAGVRAISADDTEHALIHATEYDYSRLLDYTIEKTEYTTLSDGYSWSIGGSDVDSVSGYGVDLDASLQLFYDTNSPDDDGYYYYYTKLINESAFPS